MANEFTSPDPFLQSLLESAGEPGTAAEIDLDAEAALAAPKVIVFLFEKWCLPIEFVVDTYPIPGSMTRRLFHGWVFGTTHTVEIPEEVAMPVSCRAFRSPMTLGPHRRKDGFKVTLESTKGWPARARYAGVDHTVIPMGGGAVAFCTHTPKCPKSLNFPGGIVEDAESRWVVCHDRPVEREAKYLARKQEEAADAALAKAEGLKPQAPALKIEREQPKDRAAIEALERDAKMRENLRKKLEAAQTKGAPLQAAA